VTCPPPLYIPPPKPQNHLPVKWKVVVVDGIGYAALDMQNYENLSINTADIKRWEEEIAGQIVEYLDQKQVIIKAEQ